MIMTSVSTIAKVSAGQSAPKQDEFSNTGTPFIRAGSLEKLMSGLDESELELVSEDIAKKRRLKLHPQGSILFAKSGMSATKGRIYALKKPAYVVSHLAILAPKRSVSAKYLRLTLNYLPPTKLIKDPAYPSISLKDIESYKLPIPKTIKDQKRIAHLLGKVESLIAQRKQNLQQLDDLLKSVFLDMFGDPVRNEKGWDIEPCNKAVINIQSGTSYGGEEKKQLDSDELGVLKISAVTKGYLDASEFKAVKKSKINKKLRFIRKGDLLFSRANTVELVAAACVVNEDSEELFLPDKLWALTLADGVNTQYFNFLLKDNRFRNTVRALASGGHESMLNISMKKFMTLNIPVPDFSEQLRFSKIVGKVDSVKSQYQKSLSDLENLYGALSQKAFKGELDLSRVPLPQEDTEVDSDANQPQKAEPNPAEETELMAEFRQLDTASFTDNFTNKKAREKLLRQFFNEWLTNHSHNSKLTLEDFWSSARVKALDYILEEDDDIEFNASDYDLIKTELFTAIENGTIEQTTNMIEIEVDGKKTLEPGNHIILKKLG